MSTQKKILIVDDERVNIDLLSGILTDYAKMVALDGKIALKIAQSKNKPDLILLDIMMPGMDGYEVCRQLKANEQTKDIPVIFVTAMTKVKEETKGLELGAVDYITKPISHPVVLARVKTHLNLRAAYQTLECHYQTLREVEQLRQDVETITRHDLKSPINGIIGFSDFLLENDALPKETLQKFYKHINTNAIRLGKMVNQSMSLAQMERGVYQVDFKTFNSLTIIRYIMNDSQRLIDNKELLVTILLEEQPIQRDDIFIIYGEEQLCYTMLANLIKNALEASPNKGTILLSLHSNQKATLAIHNQGVVPIEIRERFFEKYTTSGKKTGTGIGTYSARLMAEVQKGTIQLQTVLEKETIVTVELLKGKNDEFKDTEEQSQPEDFDC